MPSSVLELIELILKLEKIEISRNKLLYYFQNYHIAMKLVFGDSYIWGSEIQ